MALSLSLYSETSRRQKLLESTPLKHIQQKLQGVHFIPIVFNNLIAIILTHSLSLWTKSKLQYPSCPSHFRYHGYFDNTEPYKQNKQYWHVIAGRLAFVFVFQFSVYVITSFIAWLVPDVPRDLDLKSKREKHLAKAVFKNQKAGYNNDGNGHKNDEML